MDQDNLESSLDQIIFLRGRKDHLLCSEMTEECFTALSVFLQRQWKDFGVAYRAAHRATAYREHLVQLTRPFHQEFYPGWVVHWIIGLDPKAPDLFDPELTDYRIMVVLLQRPG